MRPPETLHDVAAGSKQQLALMDGNAWRNFLDKAGQLYGTRASILVAAAIGSATHGLDCLFLGTGQSDMVRVQQRTISYKRAPPYANTTTIANLVMFSIFRVNGVAPIDGAPVDRRLVGFYQGLHNVQDLPAHLCRTDARKSVRELDAFRCHQELMHGLFGPDL